MLLLILFDLYCVMLLVLVIVKKRLNKAKNSNKYNAVVNLISLNLMLQLTRTYSHKS